MAFINMQFPTEIGFHAIGGPGFLTNIAAMASGAESRNQEWAYERAEYEVSHAARLPAAWRPLQAFFRIAGGRANSWRFKDWLDYQVAGSESSLVNIDATHAYLAKNYVFGSFTFKRRLTKIVAGTFVPTGGSGLSLDYNTGILTYGIAPISFVTEFDVHMRFNTDAMRHEMIDRSAGEWVVTWQSIPLVEVRD